MRNAIIRTLLLLACLAGGSMAMAAEVVVIVHGGVAEQSLSRTELKNIYLGKKTLWENGSRITLSVQRSGDVHDHFVRKLITMSPGRFDRFWKQLVFTGRAKMPTRCESGPAMIDYVARTPGAIGYIASDQLEGATGIKRIGIK